MIDSLDKFFNRLFLVFKYGPELSQILEENRILNIAADVEAKKDNLQLCLRHQPRIPGAHFAEHNCDHCKLLARKDLDAPF